MGVERGIGLKLDIAFAANTQLINKYTDNKYKDILYTKFY